MSATRMARSLAFFDLLKEIVVDDRGVARARWWDANDGLKGRRLADASRANESLSSFDRTGWDLSTGLIVEVTLPATGEVGIFVDHNSTAGSTGVGVGVSFNFSTSTAFVGNVAISAGGSYTLQRTESSSTINRTQHFGPSPVTLKLLARAVGSSAAAQRPAMLDVYINEWLYAGRRRVPSVMMCVVAVSLTSKDAVVL